MYDIVEHTNAEADYDHLYDNDVVLEIVNPYLEENLFIAFESEFTLFSAIGTSITFRMNMITMR